MAKSTRSERLRPLELVGAAAGVALFVGVIVLVSTRDLSVALIFLGAAFIVALVLLAMLALATGPIGTETDLDGNSLTAPEDTQKRPGEDTAPR